MLFENSILQPPEQLLHYHASMFILCRNTLVLISSFTMKADGCKVVPETPNMEFSYQFRLKRLIDIIPLRILSF